MATFEFEFRVEGLTRASAEFLLKYFKETGEQLYRATGEAVRMVGGFVEVVDEEGSDEQQAP